MTPEEHIAEAESLMIHRTLTFEQAQINQIHAANHIALARWKYLRNIDKAYEETVEEFGV